MAKEYTATITTPKGYTDKAGIYYRPGLDLWEATCFAGGLVPMVRADTPRAALRELKERMRMLEDAGRL